MQKGFALILIIATIALGIGGYLLYQKQATPKPVPNPITGQPSETPIPTSTSIPSLKAQVKNSPSPTSLPATIYISRVKLESILPNTASSGEEIKLLGSGFGTVIGKVYLYNQSLGPSTIFADVNPNRWTDTEIKITVPAAVSGQTITVEILHKDGTKSNKTQFQIKGGQPTIDTISPNNSQPLQEITISGREFGINNGSVNIHKASSADISSPYAKCQTTSWGDTSIKCMLPSTVNNGVEYGIEIVTSDHRRSSFKYYKVGN